MAEVRETNVPSVVDGPGLVAAASGLMLIPANAPRMIRLHRLAALGMSMEDSGSRPASPSAIRSILKQDEIGGPTVRMQEDPYSEVLIQSVNYPNGPYLISPGTGEHTVADLENLIDALHREQWMPEHLRDIVKMLIRGLLTVSDMVLRRAGLERGVNAEELPEARVEVPGARNLAKLTEAAFVSYADLEAQAKWLPEVIESLALDPGSVVDPCRQDVIEDQLYMSPFLRCPGGYQVILPLDLSITIRYHLLQIVKSAGLLETLRDHWRNAAFYRFMRLLPKKSAPDVLEESDLLSRYLLPIDSYRDLHVVVATDNLTGWGDEVWGDYDNKPILNRIANLIQPTERGQISSAEEILHLLITDSPGRGAFWGVPNVGSVDPVLIARSDDLEAIMHNEPDGLLGLLLFARAIERRPGRSMSTSILDEYAVYLKNEKSFYLSDDAPATFTFFQVGDGLDIRKDYFAEVDPHGVVPPIGNAPILQARRRYLKDAAEVQVIEPNPTYLGFLVEHQSSEIFVTINRADNSPIGVEFEIMEAVAYWTRECAVRASCDLPNSPTELILDLGDAEIWKRATGNAVSGHAVEFVRVSTREFHVTFTESFVALLSEDNNDAERVLVTQLLLDVFGLPVSELQSKLDLIAPLGPKRMINAFSQDISPDMLAEGLPRALTGHDQVAAVVLDELGDWLRLDDGGGYSEGPLTGEERVKALRVSVGHLMSVLELEIARYDSQKLLDYLILQNEALLHSAKLDAIILPSRLACFGESSRTVGDLVRHRKQSTSAQRANRFLIEYLAAQPSKGARNVSVLDYYYLLAIASEISDRGTVSDFLHYGLADFEVSVLPSGRLGVSRDDPVNRAIDAYVEAEGRWSVRDALGAPGHGSEVDVDAARFASNSAAAMLAEFGFTIDQLREVCGGLLDCAKKADDVSRIERHNFVARVSKQRELAPSIVNAVLDEILLVEKSSFADLGRDSFPWLFGRNSSYVRRPVVAQGEFLVFGYRSIYRLVRFWLGEMVTGRLQGRAKSSEMQSFISKARGKVNDLFAESVGSFFCELGMAVRNSVDKIGPRRLVDDRGNNLGDVDVLAIDCERRRVFVVEAKDFEVARTPPEMANEVKKLFVGSSKKKATIALHARRISWIEANVREVLESFDIGWDGEPWSVIGLLVTSEQLVTPLIEDAPFGVVAFRDLSPQALGLGINDERAR